MLKYKYEQHNNERISKFLANLGIASRRNIDEMIERHQVKVNDVFATVGQRLNYNDVITVNSKEKQHKTYMYYKPKGEVTGPKFNIMPDAYPIGRLDKDSEGLLLYTTDNRLPEILLNPKNEREKEYMVKIREKATPRVKTLIEAGIRTHEAHYKPAKLVELLNEGKTIRIVITEGKKHEIRRMLNALHLTITELKRIRFDKFKLKTLRPGKFELIENNIIEDIISK